MTDSTARDIPTAPLDRGLGTDILLSGETAALLDTSIDTAPVREISVRGGKKPVKFYTVTGYIIIMSDRQHSTNTYR